MASDVKLNINSVSIFFQLHHLINPARFVVNKNEILFGGFESVLMQIFNCPLDITI